MPAMIPFRYPLMLHRPFCPFVNTFATPTPLTLRVRRLCPGDKLPARRVSGESR